MRLAKSLGKFEHEVKELDSPSLTKWMAYSRIEGLEPTDSWDQTARICHILVALMGDQKKKWTEADFKPQRIVATPVAQPMAYRRMIIGGIVAAQKALAEQKAKNGG